jgi:exonuclease VII large subunit
MDNEAQDELIREVAVKHGVLLDSRDPIMMLRTLNARVLKDALESQQTMLDQFKEEMESLTSRWSRDAKDKAERVLNAALSASKEAMESNLKQGTQSLQADIDAAMERIASRLDQTRQAAMLNVVASCLTCVAAAIALWAAFK